MPDKRAPGLLHGLLPVAVGSLLGLLAGGGLLLHAQRQAAEAQRQQLLAAWSAGPLGALQQGLRQLTEDTQGNARHPELLAALAGDALLAGCQTPAPASEDFGSGLVALYASPAEATAVALGQFGAVPVALAREEELQPASDCPGARAALQRCSCMRSLRTGQTGWVPAVPAEPAPAHLLQALGGQPR